MFRFVPTPPWRLALICAAGLGGFAIGCYRQLAEARRSWGVDPAEAVMTLPGDELVADALVSETRGIDIDAPPTAVWPWLVQMGFGRGGWYSYDPIDMGNPSADDILGEYQGLAVGDRVPTHPGGGFEVRILRPNEALVLWLDSELANASTEDTATPMGLQGAGLLGGLAMSDFHGSWTFVLEPAPGGRTRLIERFRLWAADAGRPQRLAMPMLGLGVFVMTRKHMLGLKDRAERRIGAEEDQ